MGFPDPPGNSVPTRSILKLPERLPGVPIIVTEEPTISPQVLALSIASFAWGRPSEMLVNCFMWFHVFNHWNPSREEFPESELFEAEASAGITSTGVLSGFWATEFPNESLNQPRRLECMTWYRDGPDTGLFTIRWCTISRGKRTIRTVIPSRFVTHICSAVSISYRGNHLSSMKMQPLSLQSKLLVKVQHFTCQCNWCYCFLGVLQFVHFQSDIFWWTFSQSSGRYVDFFPFDKYAKVDDMSSHVKTSSNKGNDHSRNWDLTRRAHRLGAVLVDWKG